MISFISMTKETSLTEKIGMIGQNQKTSKVQVDFKDLWLMKKTDQYFWDSKSSGTRFSRIKVKIKTK